jgi:hypothetical protein
VHKYNKAVFCNFYLRTVPYNKKILCRCVGKEQQKQILTVALTLHLEPSLVLSCQPAKEKQKSMHIEFQMHISSVEEKV